MLSVGLWRYYVNITVTILNIMHRPGFYKKLNSIDLSVPHRKHITSPLRAQQVNVICRFVPMVYYHSSGHYPSSCLLFKIQRFGDSILTASSDETYLVGPNRYSWLRRQISRKTHTAPHSRRRHSSQWPLWEPQILQMLISRLRMWIAL
jgi:hypothetical protein